MLFGFEHSDLPCLFSHSFVVFSYVCLILSVRSMFISNLFKHSHILFRLIVSKAFSWSVNVMNRWSLMNSQLFSINFIKEKIELYVYDVLIYMKKEYWLGTIYTHVEQDTGLLELLSIQNMAIKLLYKLLEDINIPQAPSEEQLYN